MPKRSKSRESLEEILASCSDTLFPADLGKAKVQIDSADADGDTPLHVLLWRGNDFGAKCLIEAGADVNAAGDMSETPLHIATRKQNAAIVALLLKAGAKPDVTSEFGQTPRSIAAELGGEINRVFK
jgi:ankyrin repeat protein